MKIHQRFLESYRVLEDALRTRELAVKDYEAELSPQDSDRLRLCRSMRNFLSHSEGGESFAVPTEEEVAFLDELAGSLCEGAVLVKKKMVPLSKCLTVGCSYEEAAAAVVKKKGADLLFFTKEGAPAGVLNAEAVCAAFAGGATRKSRLQAPAKPPKVEIVLDTDRVGVLKGYPKGSAVAVANASGKVVGYANA